MNHRASSPIDRLQASALACVRWHGGLPLVDRIYSSHGTSTVLQSSAMIEGSEMAAKVPSNTNAVLNMRVESGTHARLVLGGRRVENTYRVGEGSLIAPGVETRWSLRPDLRGGWFNIVFHESALQALSENEGATIDSIPHLADPMIGMLAQQIFELTGHEDEPEPLLWQSLTHILLWRVSQLAKGSSSARTFGGLAAWQARRTTEYLADNIGRKVTLDELAAIARLSPFHFARAFTRTVGMPPYRYQQKLRLDRARELLGQTDMRVIDVALAVGYESQQALSRVFSQQFGVTPSQWRRFHSGD